MTDAPASADPRPRPLRGRFARGFALVGGAGFVLVAAGLLLAGRSVFDGMWLGAVLAGPSLHLSDPIGEALFARNLYGQFAILVMGGAAQYAVVGAAVGWTVGRAIDAVRGAGGAQPRGS
ncbi:MAG: hypothetical protein ABTQ29_15800 [Siculibacillus sp.]